MRLSKGNATQNFYLHVRIKSWPFKIRGICGEVSFPDNLDCLRERSMEEHFFSPECSSVRRQGWTYRPFEITWEAQDQELQPDLGWHVELAWVRL